MVTFGMNPPLERMIHDDLEYRGKLVRLDRHSTWGIWAGNILMVTCRSTRWSAEKEAARHRSTLTGVRLVEAMPAFY